MTGAQERPEGAPGLVEWNGILEGRTDDPAATQRAADELSACGRAKFSCEVQGGRFSLLPQDTAVTGAGFDEEAQTRFFGALERLVATARRGTVESTLRAKMVYATQVAETLFALQQAELAPVTRLRPRLEGEGGSLNAPAARGGRRREVLILAPLLVLFAVFFGWRNGWFDRVLSARAETLAVATGPFGDILALRVERHWGNYEVEVRRGAGYPKSPAAFSALRAAADSLVAQAACDAVNNGDDAWVQVVNEAGEVRATCRFEMRALLLDPEAKIKVLVPGAMDAATLQLSLTKDAPQKR